MPIASPIPRTAAVTNPTTPSSGYPITCFPTPAWTITDEPTTIDAMTNVYCAGTASVAKLTSGSTSTFAETELPIKH
jgi:hypothetical protein